MLVGKFARVEQACYFDYTGNFCNSSVPYPNEETTTPL